MVGIGGDCRWENNDYHNTPACISDGRIRMQGSMHNGCTFTAGVNPTAGLICCRDDFQQADGVLSGVLGYYSFDDSTVTDKSGNGRDGGWERGTEAYAEGVFGTKGALFDGSSRVTVDAFKNYNWGQSVSVSIWFKRTSADGYQSIVSNGYYDTGSWEIRMGREGGGTMLGGGFITDVHGTAWDHVGDFYGDHATLQGRVPPATLGEWHHVAMTYDGSVIHFYVDGVQEAGKVRSLVCKHLPATGSKAC
jgi:hypothetical protein